MIRLRRRRVAPSDLLEGFESATGRERFYWERPESGEALLGIGAAVALESEGPDRFDLCARAVRELWQRIPNASRGPALSRPRLVGGFAFLDRRTPTAEWRDFPPARWVLPSELWVQHAEEAWQCRVEIPARARANVAARPARSSGLSRSRDASLWTPGPSEAEASPCDYRDRVSKAIAAIRSGELEKIVVARSERIRASRPLDATRWLRNLRTRHPGCTLFALTRGPFTLLGASPERLVSVAEGRARVDVVAGSSGRGASPSEDHALARQLRESKKEQAEHAIVVRAVRTALAASCREIESAEAPRLLRTRGIQHLFTPVTARLHAPTPSAALELAGALHPTPAVGGEPSRPALDWLERHEGLDRGWYAGPIGWLDASGSGELSVALRLALVCGRDAILYAGAGIVADSEAHSELRETELKLASVRAAYPWAGQ